MSSSGLDTDGAFGEKNYGSQYYLDLLEWYSPGDTSTAHIYGVAMFLLVLSSILLVVYLLFMVVFFLKHNVFEIRARSPWLVMLTGACVTATLPVTMLAQTVVIFDTSPDNLPYHYIFVHYFILVCTTSCYGSRTIRLAVMRNARARKAVPWLLPEWHHVVVCLFLGAAALAFPLYELHDIPDGPFASLIFRARSSETLWRLAVACQVVVLALWVINWKTDDIFNITGELRTATASEVLVTVAGKLAEDHLGAPYNRWFGTENIRVLTGMILFSVSVGNPIRKLLFNPLESRDPTIANALAKRKDGGVTIALRDASIASTGTDEDTAADLADPSNVIWTYEKVAKISEVSAAFDTFSRRALCHESVLFLKDVRSYQSRSDGGLEASADGSGVGNNGDMYSNFAQIVLKYIMDGAPDEVNLSHEDTSAILKVHQAGRSDFYALGKRERRFVFASAYTEVRYVVETNLMERFVSSDGFKAAARLASMARGGVVAPNVRKDRPMRNWF